MNKIMAVNTNNYEKDMEKINHYLLNHYEMEIKQMTTCKDICFVAIGEKNKNS